MSQWLQSGIPSASKALEGILGRRNALSKGGLSRLGMEGT